MKKIIILGCLALAGCGIFLAPFDNNEYSYLNQLYTFSEYYKSDCGNTSKTLNNFEQLSLISTTLVNYSQDLPNNSSTTDAVKTLDKIVQASKQQINTGTHGKKFCELELENIKHAAGTIKSAVATRGR